MITLRVLGSVDLRKHDGQSVHTLLAQPKRVALLALLCTRSGEEFVRRDLVASLFWPEHDHEHARAGLRTALHALRRGLGDVIAARGNDEVGVARDAISCDAVAFERACRDEKWAEAVDLYHGDFLVGLHVFDSSAELDHWIDEQRARYRQLATTAAWRLCAVEERRGNLAGALGLARRAIGWTGTDEVGLRRLLLLHETLGDRAGAVAAFDAFRRKVRDELEIEPSAETLDLIESIRQGRPLPASQPPLLRSRTVPLMLSPSDRVRRWAVAVAGVAVVLVLLGSVWSLSHRANTVMPAAPATGNVSELAAGVRGFLRVTPMPVPLSHASVAYDALRDKVYVFGGNSQGRGHTNDVWFMDQPGTVGSVTWTRLDPRGRRPQSRFGQPAVYDSIADRMIVVGGAMGYTLPCANDVWVLKGPSLQGGTPQWLELKPVGEAPAPRADHSAVWVPRTRRVVVFGGHDCVAQRFDDTWVLDLADSSRPRWRRIVTSGAAPAHRGNHSAVYDGAADRVLLFGGNMDTRPFADVWELKPASSNDARWRPMRVRGTNHPPVYAHRAAWDPIGRQMIVFGGAEPSGPSNAVWLMRDDGAGAVRWTKLAGLPIAPQARVTHGLAYNGALDELIVFGGQGEGAALFDAWVLMNVTQRRLRQQVQ